ncbi:MAG: two-component regulator propeller domain-containing protein [Bacteroidota bacterium]
MRNLLLFLIFFIGSKALCFGQYIFTNFQKKDGLSANEVICSLKDKEGFMWFGTSKGLNRYDGNNFKIFNKINKNTVSTENIFVTNLLNHSESTIYVGTQKGLFLFNKTSEIFTPILFFENGKKLQKPFQIDKIFLDSEKNVFTTTINGIFILKNNQAISIIDRYKNAKMLIGESIIGAGTTFDKYRNGLWVSTLNGLYFLNFKTGVVWSRNNNPEKLPFLEPQTIYSLCLDAENNIYISNESHNLQHYNFKTKELKIIKKGIAGRNYGMYCDSKNRLWLQSYHSKIQMLEPNGKVLNFPEGSPENYRICNIFFYSIFEDSENNLWIAGQNGVSKLASNSYLENNYTLPANLLNNEKVEYMINDLFEADNNQIWACKDDGLYLFNPADGKTIRYALDAKKLKPNRIFEMKFINGEWWCGTGNGIKIFNPKSKTFRAFKNYAIGHFLENISVIWILHDKQGMIWFSGWADAVYRFDPAKNETVRIEEVTRKSVNTSAALTNSLCAFENSDGKIWINNGDGGIIIYDNKSKTFKKANLGGDATVMNIISDENNNIWLATIQRGILKIDQNGNLLDSITVANGLNTNYINKISFDKYGRIWAANSEGMQYLNPTNKTVSKLNIDMGNPIRDLTGSLLIKNDKLFASTVNKIAVINLNQIGTKSPSILPIISGIKVFEKEIPYSSVQPILNLKYNQNFFSIQYSVLNHNEIPSLKYAYKLDGFDKNWVYNERRQVASYTNVPNGQYVFL